MTPTRSQSVVALLIIILFVLFIVVGFRANQEATRLAPRAQTPSTGTGSSPIPPFIKICVAATQQGCIPGFNPSCSVDTDCVSKIQAACQIMGNCPTDIQTKCTAGMCQYWQKGQPQPTVAPTGLISASVAPTTVVQPTTSGVNCGSCDVDGDGAITDLDETILKKCIASANGSNCQYGLTVDRATSILTDCKLRSCLASSALTPTVVPSITVSSTVIPTAPLATVTPGSCVLKSNGDINSDGKVNLLDFTIWLDEFINKPKTNLRSDTDCNGVVDLNDFNDWRKGATATSFR